MTVSPSASVDATQESVKEPRIVRERSSASVGAPGVVGELFATVTESFRRHAGELSVIRRDVD